MSADAEQPDLRQLAKESPEDYRDFAERVGDEFGEWLLSYLEGEDGGSA